MYDSFNRHIHYLRISVTDKCNLRCRYCMPAEGIPLIHHQDILRLEEIFEVARYGVEMGIDKVRITGGEPMVSCCRSMPMRWLQQVCNVSISALILLILSVIVRSPVWAVWSRYLKAFRLPGRQASGPSN